MKIGHEFTLPATADTHRAVFLVARAILAYEREHPLPFGPHPVRDIREVMADFAAMALKRAAEDHMQTLALADAPPDERCAAEAARALRGVSPRALEIIITMARDDLRTRYANVLHRPEMRRLRELVGEPALADGTQPGKEVSPDDGTWIYADRGPTR